MAGIIVPVKGKYRPGSAVDVVKAPRRVYCSCYRNSKRWRHRCSRKPGG